MNETIQTFAVYALPVLFAITLHEACHAYAAKYFGDSTAYLQGRMSLNPVKHIDPVGTLLIPIMLYLVQSPFLFGYAKPVPVNWANLRKPKRDMAWVALAGPAANIVMALMWLVLGMFIGASQTTEPFLVGMVKAGIQINLVIFAFNLFPIPPLDGGRIMTSILPSKFAYKFEKIEPYGFFIVLALVLIEVFRFWDLWMRPVMNFALQILLFVVSPLGFLLK